VTIASAQGLASSPAVSLAARVPASFFSMPMGVGGLAAAWRAASRAYHGSAWVADALLALAAALWLVLFAAQVVKALTARDRLRAELEHPVQGSLAALAPASLLLLAAGIAVHSSSVALVLFWIGAAGQLAFGAYVVGRWFTTAIEPGLVTPAMYLPPVAGNLLAATAAGALGLTDVGWLFFGAGVVAWILVAATMLGRYLSAGELPARLRPLLGIELAPPAIAFVALQSIDGPHPDAALRTLLGFSLFVALVLLRLAGTFRRVPFTAAYWAFTFPLAALSTGLLRQAAVASESIAAALALPGFVVANAVIAVVAFRTVTAVSRGELLSPE
jgi:tellurite resistance protein